MLKNLIIFVVLFKLSSLTVFAVHIQGTAPDYVGRRIAVFAHSDELSERKLLLTYADISENGSFTLDFDLISTRELTLRINRVEAVLYAEPEASYTVVFPSAASADIRKFDRTVVELIFENSSEFELNSLIRSVNADYAGFINDHYYDYALDRYRGSDVYIKHLGDRSLKADLFNGTGKPDSLAKVLQPRFALLVNEFCQTMQNKYAQHNSHDFFQEYLKYSLAELRLMAGMNRMDFYREYWMSKAPAVFNPAYANCFVLFFNNYLLEQPRELQEKIKRTINVDRSAQRLLDVTSGDSVAQSQDVRALAIILSLRDLHTNKAFTRIAVERCLESFGELETASDVIRNVAQDILFDLRKCKENWLLEDLVLVDEREEKWSLAEQDGKIVYLFFFASWNTASLKEMLILQKLWEKYRKDILIVAVNMDEDYNTFKKYLQDHPDEKFIHVYGNGDPLITEKCDIRALPHAIFINEDGRIRSNFTRKPSEGIQMEFDKVVLEQAQQKQGPKTWKD